MKRILINANHQDEVRVAIVEDGYLHDLDIESIYAKENKSNIYIGFVENVAPSLNAAFIDYGEEKRGFLPLDDFKKNYNLKKVPTNMKLTVQVQKDERGAKGAFLTANIGIPGRYLVFLPKSNNKVGISRKIQGQERARLKEVINKLEIPDNSGVIIRTACIDKSFDELNYDLDYLCRLWKTINKKIEKATKPTILFKESNVVIRTLRDYLNENIDELLIDNKVTFYEARNFVKSLMPEYIDKLKFYNSTNNLFNEFQIEEQIELAYKREVPLSSGGTIVIDHTEALTTIDVNSKHSTRSKNIRDTALKTNLEACVEISRQLKIRDIGGLVVIDFIDMSEVANRKKVENKLKALFSTDRARIQTSNISNLGLVELSRQRISTSLIDGQHITCPRCKGQGTIRDIESLAISIIRILTEKSALPDVDDIIITAESEIVNFLQNDQRSNISKIETLNNVNIFITPENGICSSEYTITTNPQNNSNKANQLNIDPKRKNSHVGPKSRKFKRNNSFQKQGLFSKITSYFK